MFLHSRRIPVGKSQSAMEYLMTYGWSILIVAVVLGALAYLGIFNPLYFAPKANPGSCQAFRPNGPLTSYDINLLGECQGEIPEYVAAFPDTNPSDNIQLTSPNIHYTSITVVAWINVAAIPSGPPQALIAQDMAWPCGASTTFFFGFYEQGAIGCASSVISSSIGITPGNWYQLAYTQNSVATWYFIDGKPAGAVGGAPLPYSTANIVVNAGAGGIYPFNYPSAPDYISNIQIYNSSLDPNSIAALYQEGIGGAPIDLQNLVGWWPLNGNANDYSGNGDNGVLYGVKYYSNWLSGYSP